jgi:hypothetical protein
LSLTVQWKSNALKDLERYLSKLNKEWLTAKGLLD